MRFDVRMIAVALVGFCTTPGLAQDRQTSPNALAARILNDENRTHAAGSWSSLIPNPNHKSSVVFSTQAVSGASPAILTVSCIRREASVNILFDGPGTVLPSVVQIAVHAPGKEKLTYFGVPLPAADSVGVFRGTANYFVQDIQSADYVDISLLNEQLTWRFRIDGLTEALTQVDDDCYFINWRALDPSFLRLARLEMLRKSGDTGDLQQEIELLSSLIDGDRIGSEFQESDHETLQRILKELTEHTP
ncbi:hypothetical protein [Ruegeria sp.]|uniref:hypothetical protein n=1 Tax=Ruegeria sp. TaxID=1879320 RepID=UPI003B59717D